MNFLVPALPKRVDRQSSAARTALTSVYRAPGTVMEKLTVRMELTKRAVRQSSAQTQSSAAGTDNACHPPSCVTTRLTVTTAATRPPARPSPAAPRPSSVTTPFVFHACGPATETPIAQTARTSGPRTVVQRHLTLLPLISAHPWSSTVAAANASMAAGSVMGELTASIDQMKLTVLVPPAVLMSLNVVMALASMGASSATINTTART